MTDTKFLCPNCGEESETVRQKFGTRRGEASTYECDFCQDKNIKITDSQKLLRDILESHCKFYGSNKDLIYIDAILKRHYLNLPFKDRQLGG